MKTKIDGPHSPLPMRPLASLVVLALALAADRYDVALSHAATFPSTGGPAFIPESGAFTACLPVNVNQDFVVGDANVQVTGIIPPVGEVTMRLEGPGARSTLMLMNRPGRTGSGAGNGNVVFLTPLKFDDEAASGLSAEDMGDPPCASFIGSGPDCPDNYVPAPDPPDTPTGLGARLNQFDGKPSLGAWSLCITDSVGPSFTTGVFNSWSLELVEDPNAIFSDGFESGGVLEWTDGTG